MTKPRVYADFHNSDARGRLRLNCTGTIEDLSAQGIELREGLALTLYSDDADQNGNLDELVADGTVSYSADEGCWVAAVDWDAIRHVSDDPRAQANGCGRSSKPATVAGTPDGSSSNP
jgi:hypothetical protein